MGSLYDIGNFRYRHYTFYSCGNTTVSSVAHADGNSPVVESQTCTGAPPNSIADNGNEVDEIVNFLDRTWPYKGLFIGDSSEGDYAFVTYVTQTPTTLDVKQIYVYKRVRSIDVENSTATDTKYLLIWERVMDPVTSLKPGLTQNI